MKILIALLLLINSIACIGQMTLAPGANAFEKKWIKNDAYQMRWFALRDTVKFEIGKVSTKVQVDRNYLTIVTEVNMTNSKIPWVDSTIADIKTLTPVRHASYNMQRDMILNFGKVVTGFYHDKMGNSNTVIRDTVKEDYFDSNLYPMLIGWLPLKQGYQQTISIYDYNPSCRSSNLKAFVKDVQSGTYQTAHSGTKEIWMVTVTDEIGKDGFSTYYFDKKDRTLWKQEITLGSRKMEMQREE